jgi:dihydrofolate reductase
MPKLFYGMSVSLDGYIEDRDGTLNWVTVDEELHRHFNEWEERNIDTHLYGRRMWELMSDAWPTAESNEEYPEWMREYGPIWNRARKYVFSKSLDSVSLGAELIRGDAAAEVRRIKEIPGKGISIGGATFATAMANEGLVDEFWLYLTPVAVGGGKRVFEGLARELRFELVGTQQFGSGVVMLRYDLKK